LISLISEDPSLLAHELVISKRISEKQGT